MRPPALQGDTRPCGCRWSWFSCDCHECSPQAFFGPEATKLVKVTRDQLIECRQRESTLTLKGCREAPFSFCSTRRRCSSSPLYTLHHWWEPPRKRWGRRKSFRGCSRSPLGTGHDRELWGFLFGQRPVWRWLTQQGRLR